MREIVTHTSTGRDLPMVFVGGVTTCPTCGGVVMDGEPCKGCWGEK